MSRYEDFKKANETFNTISNNKKDYLIIHYSCESFYNKYDGASPRITCIAVMNLESKQTDTFAIHLTAELNQVDLENIVQNYDSLEKEMLDDFFDFVKSKNDKTWIHWNMRNSNFGFKAIEHRHKVLGGTPVEIDDNRKIDLSSLFIQKYTSGFASNPRIESLMEMNKIKPMNFLKGAEEAKAFDDGEYIKLSQSTIAKVGLFHNFLSREFNGSLKLKVTKREIYGSTLQGRWNLIKSTKTYKIVLTIFGFLFTTIGGAILLRKLGLQ